MREKAQFDRKNLISPCDCKVIDLNAVQSLRLEAEVEANLPPVASATGDRECKFRTLSIGRSA